jgi:hypothetical protein
LNSESLMFCRSDVPVAISLFSLSASASQSAVFHVVLFSAG